MGAAGETGTTAAANKTSKAGAPTAAATVTSAPPSTYSDWAAAFQAYYSAGGQPPPGAAFAGHPYMWAGQPMMPPYGSPHPQYSAMYPPAGMYAHPGMYGHYGPHTDAMVSAEQTESKPELKVTEGGRNQAQKQGSLKRSKGSKGSLLSMGTKGSEGGKGSGSMAMSQSSNGDDNESGSEGSTDGSEDNTNEQHRGQKGSGSMAMDVTGAGSYGANPVQAVSGTPAAGGSLDMSLDYWNAGNATPAKTGKQMSASPSVNATPPSELWLQDEREVKRQRRKQSNRESARRSRLRKQAECEELGARADTLAVENQALRNELARVTEECKRLEAENASLVEQVQTITTSVTPAPAEASVPLVQDVPANKDVETESPSQGNGSVKRTDDTPAGADFLPPPTLNITKDLISCISGFEL